MDFANFLDVSTVITLGVAVEGVYLFLFDIVRSFEIIRLYGASGIILCLFGSRNVWRLQAQVLGGLKDDDAFSFTKSIKDECTMIAVAVRELTLPTCERCLMIP
jgi:hypothetical protein